MNDALTPSIPHFQAGYVDVAGIATWHEVAGQGPVVLLLHGAFTGASSWAAQARALARAGFRVHVPERRGHARTCDVDAAMSYGSMASETVAYLKEQVGAPAHLVGRSDGAVVALLVALQHPDLVERLVLIGKFYNSTGRVPDTDLERWLRTEQAKVFLRQGYGAVSPDGPDHFPVVYEKTMAMVESGPEMNLDDLQRVSAPTLVLQADRDVVTLEHGAAVANALQHGRFAVLPGSHSLTSELPGPVNALIAWFLGSG